jgi:hypothetical protein
MSEWALSRSCIPTIVSGSTSVCTMKVRSRASSQSSRRCTGDRSVRVASDRAGKTRDAPCGRRATASRTPTDTTPLRSWCASSAKPARTTTKISISISPDQSSAAAGSALASAATARPDGSQRIQSGSADAMSNMNVLSGRPMEMTANRTGKLMIEMTACRLRKRCGGSVSRKPVSASVCKVATTNSRASVNATPTSGAVQRYRRTTRARTGTASARGSRRNW